VHGKPESSNRQEQLLAALGDVPGIRPEAQVDGPPVVRQAFPGEARHQGAEIDHAVAERGVRAGLVVARGVLVAGIVAVDQVDVVDPARELVDELELAARQGFLPAMLPGADDGDHLAVTGVVHHAEVVVRDRIEDAQHVGRL
jgi:hypothetical protein